MPINKIKILMLSAGMITGAFRMMMDIIERIDNKRFSIYVAYKPEYSEWGEYELNSISNAGAKIVPLTGKSLFDPRGLIDLWVTLRKERINILHNWDVLGVPSRIIAKIAGVLVAEELANAPPIVMQDISLKHYIINKWTSIFVDGYAACSRGVMDQYLKKSPMFFKRKTLSVILNCIDAPSLVTQQNSSIDLFKKYNIQEQDIILTNIGYFNEQKAQSDLLLAFKRIVEKRNDVKLIIVGWGRLENELKFMAKQLCIEKRVIFTGKLLRKQIFEIFLFTDLFVLSSHWEGLPLVLVEAMVMRTPVVSTDFDSAHEIVDDGKTGILVPIGSPEVMARTILNLLEEPDKMLQMGEKGQNRAIQNFGCEKYIRGYEEFYENIILKTAHYRNGRKRQYF